jgi:hypothetical protein
MNDFPGFLFLTLNQPPSDAGSLTNGSSRWATCAAHILLSLDPRIPVHLVVPSHL